MPPASNGIVPPPSPPFPLLFVPCGLRMDHSSARACPAKSAPPPSLPSIHNPEAKPSLCLLGSPTRPALSRPLPPLPASLVSLSFSAMVSVAWSATSTSAIILRRFGLREVLRYVSRINCDLILPPGLHCLAWL